MLSCVDAVVRTLAGIKPSHLAAMVDLVKMADVRPKTELDQSDRLTDEAKCFMQAMEIWSEAVPVEGTDSRGLLARRPQG